MVPSSRTTDAVLGAIRVKSETADRVILRVISSNTSPSMNSQVTIAASLNSPIMKAPITAKETKTSIETTLTLCVVFVVFFF